MSDAMQYAILVVTGGFFGWYGVDLYRLAKAKFKGPGDRE